MKKMTRMTSIKRVTVLVCASVMSVTLAAAAAAQPQVDRKRATERYRKGVEFLGIEEWNEAVSAFNQAVEIDQKFTLAYYGLGRAYVGLKRFPEAIAAYTTCRELFRANAGNQFSNQVEAQQRRKDHIMELDETIRQYQIGPQSQQTQLRLQELQEYRRRIQQESQRGGVVDLKTEAVPPFVLLALGSAYFRSSKLQDAEREYLAAIQAKPDYGEAHSNMAVVYMMTGRYDEAEKSVKAAEQAGFKVNPALKEEIKSRRIAARS